MLPLILAAAGLLKGLGFDKEKEDRQRKLAAETQRYSPWTKMQAGEIKEADPMGNALQFGMSGYGVQQNMENRDAYNQNMADNKQFRSDWLDVQRQQAGQQKPAWHPPMSNPPVSQYPQTSQNGSGYGNIPQDENNVADSNWSEEELKNAPFRKVNYFGPRSSPWTTA